MQRTYQTAMLSAEVIKTLSLSYGVIKVDFCKTIGLFPLSQTIHNRYRGVLPFRALHKPCTYVNYDSSSVYHRDGATSLLNVGEDDVLGRDLSGLQQLLQSVNIADLSGVSIVFRSLCCRLMCLDQSISIRPFGPDHFIPGIGHDGPLNS